jgi:hypothetical protein
MSESRKTSDEEIEALKSLLELDKSAGLIELKQKLDDPDAE